MQEVACGIIHLVVTSITVGILVSADIRATTDLIRDLGLNLVADWSGVLLWNLVALLLDILLAVRSRGVSTITRLSISLVVTSMNLVGIMSNNSRAVVNLGVSFLAVLGDNVLTLLNVCGVHNCVALLVILDVVLGVAVLLMVSILVMTTSGGSNGAGGYTQNNNKSEHLEFREYLPCCTGTEAEAICLLCQIPCLIYNLDCDIFMLSTCISLPLCD